ncbi:MAG: hypothetical protein ACOYT8_03580 [Candidatus Dependentiae bacterium]
MEIKKLSLLIFISTFTLIQGMEKIDQEINTLEKAIQISVDPQNTHPNKAKIKQLVDLYTKQNVPLTKITTTLDQLINNKNVNQQQLTSKEKPKIINTTVQATVIETNRTLLRHKLQQKGTQNKEDSHARECKLITETAETHKVFNREYENYCKEYNSSPLTPDLTIEELQKKLIIEYDRLLNLKK